MVDTEPLKCAERKCRMGEDGATREYEASCNSRGVAIVLDVLFIKTEPCPKALHKLGARFPREDERRRLRRRRCEEMGALGDDVGDTVKMVL